MLLKDNWEQQQSLLLIGCLLKSISIWQKWSNFQQIFNQIITIIQKYIEIINIYSLKDIWCS